MSIYFLNHIAKKIDIFQFKADDIFKATILNPTIQLTFNNISIWKHDDHLTGFTGHKDPRPIWGRGQFFVVSFHFGRLKRHPMVLGAAQNGTQA